MQYDEENSEEKTKRKIFIFLSSMAADPLDYLKIPAERVITIGTSVKI